MAFKRRSRASTGLHVLLIDTSSSSISGNALRNTKGLMRELARHAYLERQLLCVIGFGNDTIDLIHGPQRPPKHYLPILNEITAGGGTPLRKALKYTQALLQRWNNAQRFPERTIYLFTDGRTNDDIEGITINHPINVIDTENTSVRLGRSKHIANSLGGHYTHISQYAPHNTLPAGL